MTIVSWNATNLVVGIEQCPCRTDKSSVVGCYDKRYIELFADERCQELFAVCVDYVWLDGFKRIMQRGFVIDLVDYDAIVFLD